MKFSSGGCFYLFPFAFYLNVKGVFPSFFFFISLFFQCEVVFVWFYFAVTSHHFVGPLVATVSDFKWLPMDFKARMDAHLFSLVHNDSKSALNNQVLNLATYHMPIVNVTTEPL